MIRSLIAALIFIVSPLVAFAHTSGIFYETVVDGVHIDVGYSSAAPSVGEAVIFDFNLAASQTPVINYTDVWVRVESEDGSVVLATALYNAEFGGPRMSYVFPRAGNFTISMRYENGSTAIAKASFPITVVPASSGGVGNLPWYVFLGLGTLIGGGAAFFVVKKKKGPRA